MRVEGMKEMEEDISMLLSGTWHTESNKWLNLAEQYLATSTFARDIYPIWNHLRGDWVWMYDLDGKKYLDFTSGVGVRAFGHFSGRMRHIRNHLTQVIWQLASLDFDHLPQIILAKHLLKHTPGGEKKQVFFTTSGSRAVETALKSVFDRKKKFKIIAFHPAFHGRTGYSLAVSSSKPSQTEGYPQAFPVVRSPYAYCYRCPFGEEPETCSLACVQVLKDQLSYSGVDDIAGIILEPVAGEGGIIVPPAKFVQAIAQLAKEIQVELISDEVQAGFGRTGTLWAIQNFGVEADYIASGKALGGGFPLGACIGPSPMFTAPGRHSETFSAEPFSAILSLSTLYLVLQHLSHVQKMGALWLEKLHQLKEEFPFVGDVRGLGLMSAIEIVRDKKSKERAPDLVRLIIKNCVEEGLVLLPAGLNSIRFLPPLDVTEEILNEAFSRLTRACARTTRS
ncbi:MAG: aspartate aminotransferase family protein [bacterium JZ-2024 1]